MVHVVVFPDPVIVHDISKQKYDKKLEPHPKRLRYQPYNSVHLPGQTGFQGNKKVTIEQQKLDQRQKYQLRKSEYLATPQT